uniref:Uncharacterized protein n=1 Tax=Chenopodium quinoa TaxID=63459 RepID=A0A803LYE8_CHEQI
MAPTLEAIRGGGGSVKVGTIGTIGSLMTREIESSSPRTSVPAVRGNGPLKPRKKTKVQNLSTTTPRRPKQKTPFEDVGKNSTVSQGTSKRSLDPSGKTRSRKRSYHIPMLGSENIHLDKTPIRDKPTKKGSTIVDIVDIHCGNPGGSISNRLKKLNFSKLSQSFM